MSNVKNYSGYLKLIEELRIEAKVPLVWLFRIRIKDIQENKIRFLSSRGASKRIKVSKPLMRKIKELIEERGLLANEHIFFHESKMSPIRKSEYFLKLWHRKELGTRQKIRIPNIDEVDNVSYHDLSEHNKTLSEL